jgi:hypothetical protein
MMDEYVAGIARRFVSLGLGNSDGSMAGVHESRAGDLGVSACHKKACMI